MVQDTGEGGFVCCLGPGCLPHSSAFHTFQGRAYFSQLIQASGCTLGYQETMQDWIINNNEEVSQVATQKLFTRAAAVSP